MAASHSPGNSASFVRLRTRGVGPAADHLNGTVMEQSKLKTQIANIFLLARLGTTLRCLSSDIVREEIPTEMERLLRQLQRAEQPFGDQPGHPLQRFPHRGGRVLVPAECRGRCDRDQCLDRRHGGQDLLLEFPHSAIVLGDRAARKSPPDWLRPLTANGRSGQAEQWAAAPDS